MKYSSELAKSYSEKREQFNETDTILVGALKFVGVKDKDIIDLGCGDGRHARLIKEMGATQVVGVDVNEKMIALAKEKDKEGVAFVVADGRKLPLQSSSADVVVSNFVMHYFSDSTQVFNEISRVLREGGHFIGTFNITDADEGFEHLYNQPMPIRLGDGQDSIIVQNLIKSREEIEKAIDASGLSIVKEEELNHPSAVIDDSFSHKAHVHKHAVLMVLQKNVAVRPESFKG